MWTGAPWAPGKRALAVTALDRKSTRLNSKSRLHLVCRLLLEKKKPVSFAQPENTYVLDAGWADRPLPQGNEQTARLCAEQCRSLLDRTRARTRVSERVTDQLLRPGSSAEMAAVAAALGMATRTPHRHLAAEDTTFRLLVGEVRGALAEGMLSHRMTVAEVAERLG